MARRIRRKGSASKDAKKQQKVDAAQSINEIPEHSHEEETMSHADGNKTIDSVSPTQIKSPAEVKTPSMVQAAPSPAVSDASGAPAKKNRRRSHKKHQTETENVTAPTPTNSPNRSTDDNHMTHANLSPAVLETPRKAADNQIQGQDLLDNFKSPGIDITEQPKTTATHPKPKKGKKKPAKQLELIEENADLPPISTPAKPSAVIEISDNEDAQKKAGSDRPNIVDVTHETPVLDKKINSPEAIPPKRGDPVSKDKDGKRTFRRNGETDQIRGDTRDVRTGEARDNAEGDDSSESKPSGIAAVESTWRASNGRSSLDNVHGTAVRQKLRTSLGPTVRIDSADTATEPSAHEGTEAVAWQHYWLNQEIDMRNKLLASRGTIQRRWCSLFNKPTPNHLVNDCSARMPSGILTVHADRDKETAQFEAEVLSQRLTSPQLGPFNLTSTRPMHVNWFTPPRSASVKPTLKSVRLLNTLNMRFYRQWAKYNTSTIDIARQ